MPVWTYAPVDPELNNKDLRIYISASEYASKTNTVKDIAQRMVDRLGLMEERTAMAFKEKDRAKVLELFSQKIITPPVSYSGAQVSALKTEKPDVKFIQPSKPELLNSATINSGLFIMVNFKNPGICYKLMFQGEKRAVNENIEAVIKAFKSIRFLTY
jgi:hypothetical protein